MCIYRADAGTCAKFSDISVVSYCVEGPCPDEALTNGANTSAVSKVCRGIYGQCKGMRFKYVEGGEG